MGITKQRFQKLMKKTVRNMWPLGIVFFVWLLFGMPYWAKGHVPFPSTYLATFFAPWSATHGMPVKNNAMPDVITQIYPWKRVTIDTWKQYSLPLWNPYSFSGTNHVGNYQSAVFSPVNILFFFLPEIHAWSIMILLQPLLAALGTYIFLRTLSVSKTGSVLGSMAYMFCGFITVWMAYGTLSYAVAFLPFILYGIHRYINDGDVYASMWMICGVAASFLSGHFQMSLYVLVYALGFVGYTWQRTKNTKQSIEAVIFICLGVAIAAPQIIPSFDAYRQAVRSSLFIKGEVIPWQYIVTVFSPDFYGNPVTRNDWFGHYAEWASFVGVVPLLLAILAIGTRWRVQPVLFFAIMVIVPLCLAFQTPLVDVLFALKIPVLSTSSASRIIFMMSFSLAVLSGFGIDILYKLWEKRTKKPMVMWVCGLLLALMVLWVSLLWIRPLAPDKLYIAIRNTYLSTIMVGVVCMVSVVGLFIPRRMLVLLTASLLILTSFDMVRFAAKWMPFDPKEYVYPQLPVISKLQDLTRDDHSRVFGNVGNELGSAFGLQLIEGYDAVYQHRYGRLISSVSHGTERNVDRSVVIFDKRGQYAEFMLQLLGVKYYVHKKSDGRLPWAYPFWEFPHYDRIWEDDNFEIFVNDKSLPRAFLASSYILAKKDTEILNALYTPGLSPDNTLIVEEKPAFEPMEGAGTATITAYRPTEVEISVSTSVPKLLFLSDTFDPGWRATIDGKHTQLYRAHFDFRAVLVPQGNHIIRMTYMPSSIILGFWITGFATLGLLGFYIWKIKN